MIIHDVKQGTPEWLRVRMAIPTASRFSDIIQPVKLLPSKSADKYMAQLLAEYVSGYPHESASTQFMQRGQELEPEARTAYEFEYDVDVVQVGFVTNDEGTWGCSPDGLVGGNGMIEIKTLSMENHIAAIELSRAGRVDCSHNLQIQGQMMVCGRSWCDRYYYNPRLAPVCTRIDRDAKVTVPLTDALIEFSDRLELAKKNYVPPATCEHSGVAKSICRCEVCER